MNVRKHWKNFILTAAAFFWASCSEDSNSEQVFVGPISDCSDDGSLNNGDVSSNCGGGMIALYGVAPVFDESSSSVTSSDSCEQGCDEMISSSSSDAPESSSSSEVSSSSAVTPELEAYCEDHDGVKNSDTYCSEDLAVSDFECENAAKDSAYFALEKKYPDDSLSNLPEDQMSCIRRAKYQLMTAVPEYGVFDGCLYESKVHSVTCNDGIVVETDGYKADLAKYREDIEKCVSDYATHLAVAEEKIKECLDSVEPSSSDGISSDSRYPED